MHKKRKNLESFNKNKKSDNKSRYSWHLEGLFFENSYFYCSLKEKLKDLFQKLTDKSILFLRFTHRDWKNFFG